MVIFGRGKAYYNINSVWEYPNSDYDHHPSHLGAHDIIDHVYDQDVSSVIITMVRRTLIMSLCITHTKAHCTRRFCIIYSFFSFLNKQQRMVPCIVLCVLCTHPEHSTVYSNKNKVVLLGQLGTWKGINKTFVTHAYIYFGLRSWHLLRVCIARSTIHYNT